MRSAPLHHRETGPAARMCRFERDDLSYSAVRVEVVCVESMHDHRAHLQAESVRYMVGKEATGGGVHRIELNRQKVMCWPGKGLKSLLVASTHGVAVRCEEYRFRAACREWPRQGA